MADIVNDFILDVAAEVELDTSGCNTLKSNSTPCDTTHRESPIKNDNDSIEQSKSEDLGRFPKFSRLLPSKPTRPTMLGNLTFREIAGRRRTNTHPTSVKHEGLDVLNTSLSYLLLDSSECMSVASNNKQEKINLRDFVGKTITLGPQNVSLKFVSDKSPSLPKSNGELLKIDPILLFGKKDDSNNKIKPSLIYTNKISGLHNKIATYKCDTDIEKPNEEFYLNYARESDNNKYFNKPTAGESQVPNLKTTFFENVKIDSNAANLSLLSEVVSNQSNLDKSTIVKRKYSPTNKIEDTCSPKKQRKDLILTRTISPLRHCNFDRTSKSVKCSINEENEPSTKYCRSVKNHSYINTHKEIKDNTYFKYPYKNSPSQDEITVIKEVYITTPKNSILPRNVNKLSPTYQQSTRSSNNRNTISSTVSNKTKCSLQKDNKSMLRNVYDSHITTPIDITSSDSSVIDQPDKKHHISKQVNPNVSINKKSPTKRTSKETKPLARTDCTRKPFRDSNKTTHIKLNDSTSSVENPSGVKCKSIQDQQLVSTGQISFPPTKRCFVLLHRMDNIIKNSVIDVSINKKSALGNHSPCEDRDLSIKGKSPEISTSTSNENMRNAKHLNEDERLDTVGILNDCDKLLDVKSQFTPQPMEPAASLEGNDDCNKNKHQSPKDIFINYLKLQDVSSNKQCKEVDPLNINLKKLRSYKSYIENADTISKAEIYSPNKTKTIKDRNSVNKFKNTKSKTKISASLKPISKKHIKSATVSEAVQEKNIHNVNSQRNEISEVKNCSQTCIKASTPFKPKKNKIIISKNRFSDINVKTLEIHEEIQMTEYPNTNVEKAISPLKTVGTVVENVISVNNSNKTTLNNVLPKKMEDIYLTEPPKEDNGKLNKELPKHDIKITGLTNNYESKNFCSEKGFTKNNSKPVNSRKAAQEILYSSNKRVLRSFKSNPLNTGPWNTNISSVNLSKNRKKWLKQKYLNNIEYYNSNPNLVISQLFDHTTSNINTKPSSDSNIQIIDSNHPTKMVNQITNVEDGAENAFKGKIIHDENEGNGINLTAGVKCMKRVLGNQLLKRINCNKRSRLYRAKTRNMQRRNCRNSTTSSCTNGSKSPLKRIPKVKKKNKEKIRKVNSKTSSTIKHSKCIKEKLNKSKLDVKPVVPSVQMLNLSPIDAVVIDDGDEVYEVTSDIPPSKQENDIESIKQTDPTSSHDTEVTEIVYCLPSHKNESSSSLTNNPLQNTPNNVSSQSVPQNNCNIVPWQYPMVLQHTSQNNIICSNFGFPYMFSPYQSWAGHQMSYNLNTISALPQSIAVITTQQNVGNASSPVENNSSVINQDLIDSNSQRNDDKSDVVENVNSLSKQRNNKSTLNTKFNRLKFTNKKRIQPYSLRNKYSKFRRRKLSFSRYTSPTSAKDINCHSEGNIVNELQSDELKTDSCRDENCTSQLNSNLNQTIEEEASPTTQSTSEVLISDGKSMNKKDMCLGVSLQLESSALSVETDSFIIETVRHISPATTKCESSVKGCTDKLVYKGAGFNIKKSKILRKLASVKRSHRIEFVNKESI